MSFIKSHSFFNHTLLGNNLNVIFFPVFGKNIIEMKAIIAAKEREKKTYVNSPVVSLKYVIKYTPSGAAQNVTKNFAPNVSPWCLFEAYLDNMIFSVGSADVPLIVKIQAYKAT